MALTVLAKRRCREEFVRDLQTALGGLACKFTKAELEAAADAVDDWCSTNASSFNSALPVGFRTNATQPEKAVMLAIVALQRTGVL